MSESPSPTEHVRPRRPRGRPKSEDLAGLEARLVEVSRELFFSNGYGATTMSAVAQGARVSKTTLYSRFPCKAALFRAIVADQIENWESGAYHIPIEFDTLEETLRVYGDLALRAGMTDDFVQINRLIHSESGRFPELGEIADARSKRGSDWVAGKIRYFAERDGIPCRDPEAVGDLFLMTLLGWSSSLVVSNSAMDEKGRRAWVEKMVRFFVGGRAAW